MALGSWDNPVRKGEASAAREKGKLRGNISQTKQGGKQEATAHSENISGVKTGQSQGKGKTSPGN